jgi:hypothetical protein
MNSRADGWPLSPDSRPAEFIMELVAMVALGVTVLGLILDAGFSDDD